MALQGNGPGPADRGGRGQGDRTQGHRHAPAHHTWCFPKGKTHQRAMLSEYNGGAWDTGAAHTWASSALKARPHSWRTHRGPCRREQMSPRKPGNRTHSLSAARTPATGRCLFLPAKLRSTRLWCKVSDHISARSDMGARWQPGPGTACCLLHLSSGTDRRKPPPRESAHHRMCEDRSGPGDFTRLPEKGNWSPYVTKHSSARRARMSRSH